jgi:hypothetical protein
LKTTRNLKPRFELDTIRARAEAELSVWQVLFHSYPIFHCYPHHFDYLLFFLFTLLSNPFVRNCLFTFPLDLV